MWNVKPLNKTSARIANCQAIISPNKVFLLSICRCCCCCCCKRYTHLLVAVMWHPPASVSQSHYGFCFISLVYAWILWELCVFIFASFDIAAVCLRAVNVLVFVCVILALVPWMHVGSNVFLAMWLRTSGKLNTNRHQTTNTTVVALNVTETDVKSSHASLSKRNTVQL